MVGRGTVGRASRIDQDLPLLWARITAPVMASSARDTKGDRHMAQTFLGQKRLRKYYGKIREVLEMPNLIEVQKSSVDSKLSTLALEASYEKPKFKLECSTANC